MNKATYIAGMNIDELSLFLSKGGFCPELLEYTSVESWDASLEPFFDDVSELLCEVDRKNEDERKKLCSECIRVFLEEYVNEKAYKET